MLNTLTPSHNACLLDVRAEFCSDFAIRDSLDAPEWIARGGHYCDVACSDVRDPWTCGFNYRGADWYLHAPTTMPVMKTDDKKKPVAVRGGKRAGSGRKALDSDGTVVTTLRLTGKQKATLTMLGGAEWLRGQLDMFA